MDHLNNFVASCSAGMENLVKEVILLFGGKDVKSLRGVVSWQGSLTTAYRACLWSRFASRVLLKVTSFKITDFDSLYDKCKKINWSDHLNSKISFAVSCTVSENSVLNHSHYASLRVKDAVVDQGAGQQVFVIGEDNTVMVVPIATGRGLGGWVVIEGDLQPGQKVVVRGNERLMPGQQVAPEEQEYELP